MRGSHQKKSLKFCSDGICNDAMQKLTFTTIRKFKFSRVSIPPNPPTFLYPQSRLKNRQSQGPQRLFFLVVGTLFLHINDTFDTVHMNPLIIDTGYFLSVYTNRPCIHAKPVTSLT